MVLPTVNMVSCIHIAAQKPKPSSQSKKMFGGANWKRGSMFHQIDIAQRTCSLPSWANCILIQLRCLLTKTIRCQLVWRRLHSSHFTHSLSLPLFIGLSCQVRAFQTNQTVHIPPACPIISRLPRPTSLYCFTPPHTVSAKANKCCCMQFGKRPFRNHCHTIWCAAFEWIGCQAECSVAGEVQQEMRQLKASSVDALKWNWPHTKPATHSA